MVSEFVVEVHTGPAPGVFSTRVVSSAAGGEPDGVMRLDVDRLLAGRERLGALVTGSAVVTRRTVPVGESDLRDLGETLFGALFSGRIASTYRASVAAAQERGEQLRLQLRLTAPKLAALPWEAMFDSETGTYVSRRERLVRHVPAPFTIAPLPVTGPLRVLVLVASPRDLVALDVDGEMSRLQAALAAPIREGRIELHCMPQATWAAVQSRLMAGPWHVLHFIGHGDYSLDRDQGQITLVKADGRRDLVDAERLADLLVEAVPTPRLVVLNSCNSGQEGLTDLFSGTASTLAHNGINAVAAMQFSVSDAAASEFARGFYGAIASGRGVDDAVQSGRRAILGLSNTLEWVTPVLYLRGNNTQLFDITPRTGGTAVGQPVVGPPAGPWPGPGPVVPPGPPPPTPAVHKLSWVVLAMAAAGFVTWGLTWPVAWVLGSMARRDIRRHPDQFTGGAALNTGWVTGMVGTLVAVVLLVVMLKSGG